MEAVRQVAHAGLRLKDAAKLLTDASAAERKELLALMVKQARALEASLDRLGDYLKSLTTPAQPDPADEPRDR